MTPLITSAECMASPPTPNFYGQISAQPQAPPPPPPAQPTDLTSARPSPASARYAAGDDNQLLAAGPIQQPPASHHHHHQHHSRNRHEHMPHDVNAAQSDRSSAFLLQSSPLFASYDGLAAGMSSDSELTSSATTRHHHLHHHRPYSSQSRVYHAHPVPRSSAVSSRLSHYSDSSAPPPSSASSTNRSSTQHLYASSSSQAPTPTSIGHQQQSINLTPNKTQANAANPAQMVHQAPGGANVAPSAYLASSGIIGATDEAGPISSSSSSSLAHPMQAQSGRQLPQRPFKQSMSTDRHPLGSSVGAGGAGSVLQYPQQSTTGGGGQILSESGGSPAHRNLIEAAPLDQVGGVGAYSPTQQHGYVSGGHPHPHPHSHRHHQQNHQRFAPQHHSSSVQYGSAGHVRNLRLEMDFMEKQAANLNLYETAAAAAAAALTNETSAARLPPSGAAAGTNRPASTSAVRQLPSIQTQGSLIGSMSLDQTNHQHLDPFQQNQHQLRSQQHHHHNQQHHQHHHQHQHHQDPNAAASMQPHNPHNHHQMASNDWMAAGAVGAPAVASQQQMFQRSTGGQFKQAMSIDHYHMGAKLEQHYSHQSSPTNYTGGDQYQLEHHQQHRLNQPQAAVGYEAYYPATANQQQQHEQTKAQENYYSSQQHPTLIDSAHQRQQSVPATVSSRAGRPGLHHQVSSSSSNSNQSSPQKSSQAEGYLDKQVAAAAASGYGTHGKTTYSHAPSSMAFQHSPQHHHHHHHQVTSGTSGRPEMLRRGYTSLAMTSDFGVGGELGGSQTALSESGDSSMTQTASNAHSGQLSSLSSKRSGIRAASPSVGGHEIASSSGASQHQHAREQHHSTSSSHGAHDNSGLRSESSTGLPNGANENSTLTKKSNSATQLSMTGTKKRLGFRKKQVTSFSVHRSEEVAPLDARHLVKQGNSVSESDSSVSGDSSSKSWSNSNFRQQNSEELASMSFIDGLGKGQMISRQGLASPYLGDIQLSLCDRRGNLEVEVIRVRNLQAKTNKVLPLTYVKLYLVKNRKCLAKAKTTLSNKRTLNPLFQQQLNFHEDYHSCILQTIVWGNFGKMDKKNFMGIAQISIDDLELSDTVISWYKLFLPSSLQTLPSKSLRNTLLSNSTESFTNTNNS